MPDFDFQGHTVHYETAGDGVPVVLLHCGGHSGRQWDKLTGFLQGRYRLIIPDFYGFGATPRWKGREALSHDDQAVLAAEVMRREAISNAHIVGHSYGGACAARLYIRRPKLVNSLFLIEPALANLIGEIGDAATHKEGFEVAKLFIELAKTGRDEEAWREFIDHYNGPETWEPLSDRAKARFLAQTAATAEGLRSNFGNPTTLADCRSIAVPTTLVCSEMTALYNRRVTEIMREEIPGAKWLEVASAGHMAPLTHPEPVAQMIDDHLDPLIK